MMFSSRSGAATAFAFPDAAAKLRWPPRRQAGRRPRVVPSAARGRGSQAFWYSLSLVRWAQQEAATRPRELAHLDSPMSCRLRQIADRVQPLVVSGLEVTQLRRARRTDRGRGVAAGANSDRRIRVEYSATETGHPHRQRPARDTSPSVQLERKYIPGPRYASPSSRSIALRY